MTARQSAEPPDVPSARRNLQEPAERENLSPKGHGAKTVAVRQRAVLALLSERTITGAATRCGVDESTLRRWLSEDPAFRADYEGARTASYEAGMSRVQALASRAVDALEDLLDAKDHPSVRLGAARTVAELAMHQHEAGTILRRLAELEQAQRRGAK